MKAEIKIDRLKVYAHHGVLPQEQVIGNDFEITMSVLANIDSNLICQDKLSATVNYAELVSIAKREMAIPSQLLENVAWRIGQAIMTECAGIESCNVTVSKLCPPIPSSQMQSASVTISFP